MKVRSLRLLEEQQTYEIISARDIGNGIIHLLLKGVADNVKFMCLLFRDPTVSKGRATKQRQGSRFTMKVLRHNFLRKQSGYRDIWQAVCANSRVRDKPFVGDLSICIEMKNAIKLYGNVYYVFFLEMQQPLLYNTGSRPPPTTHLLALHQPIRGMLHTALTTHYATQTCRSLRGGHLRLCTNMPTTADSSTPDRQSAADLRMQHINNSAPSPSYIYQTIRPHNLNHRYIITTYPLPITTTSLYQFIQRHTCTTVHIARFKMADPF